MKKILIINANYYDNITKKLVTSSKNFLKKEKYNLSILNSYCNKKKCKKV